METKFKKPLSNFLNKMRIDANNYAITGSLAIKAMGFNLNREVNDIDILLLDLSKMESIDNSIWDNITSKLDLLSQSYKNSDYPNSSQPMYKFLWDGIIFNVFILDPNKFSKLTIIYDKDNIPYSDIISLLEAKSQYSRSKDLKDMSYLISQISSIFMESITKLK